MKTTTLSVSFAGKGGLNVVSFENLLDTLNIGNYYASVEDMPPVLKERLERLMCLKVVPLYDAKNSPQRITGVGSRIGETLFWIEYPLGES